MGHVSSLGSTAMNAKMVGVGPNCTPMENPKNGAIAMVTATTW